MPNHRHSPPCTKAAVWLLAALIGSIPALFLASTAAAQIEAQRAAFTDVYPSAELGLWEPVEEHEELLGDYVLWPDLKAAYLRANLSDEEAVLDFLEEYGEIRPGRDIRYRHARRLARRGEHAAFLDIYNEHYAALGNAELDCLAADARIRTGHSDAAMTLARRLWLTGESQVKECDPVFAVMRNNGELTEALLRKRYELAIEKDEFLLARYVARSLGDPVLAEANLWLRAQGDPARFLRQADVTRDDAVYKRQLGFAARRLSISEPEQAWREWARLRKDMEFSQTEEHAVARSIALWAARRRIDTADELLAKLPAAAIDNEVRHWIIRDALRAGRWAHVVANIDGLDESGRSEDEWRYWKAIALEQTGNGAEAMLILSTLARQRSYYGFLAADALDIDYAIASSEIVADERAIQRLAGNAALIRARELYLTGLDGRARSEWDEAVDLLPDSDRMQAVLLAERWNWPSRAIALAAQTGRFDSLAIRYPLPHREAFSESAENAGIPVSWTYGIARSESIFMRDIRSSAGAIGLMQLMPATGRRTAKELSIPYSGLVTLTDPKSNIRLGATYLAKMHNRFGQHPAVATAAYNAGPYRVSQWLPSDGGVDARIWVETIPYRETRNYVQRVLTADIIFEWRLSGKVRRLSERLPIILPERVLQTASAQ